MTESNFQHPYEDLPLLLATGQGRSGTTVLTKALAAHPLVYSNRVESNVMKDVLLAGHLSSTMTSRVRQMVLPREQHDLVFRQMLLHLLFPIETSAEREVGSPSALSTFSAMNSDAADFAVSVFPKIHFANIVRNGIEVVASRMVHRSLGQHSFEEQCLAWSAAQEMAEWGADRDPFTLIRHERLLEPGSCRETFEQMFQKAGISYSDSVPDYIVNNRKNQTSYSHESAAEDSDLKNRQQRWDHWTNEQQTMFAKMCGPTMEYFGYPMP